MKNITLTIDDKILEAGREYARRRNTSLNTLVRKLLEEKISLEKKNWIEETFALMDLAAKTNKTKLKKWKREDLYDV
jgi:hypothetical protein